MTHLPVEQKRLHYHQQSSIIERERESHIIVLLFVLILFFLPRNILIHCIFWFRMLKKKKKKPKKSLFFEWQLILSFNSSYGPCIGHQLNTEQPPDNFPLIILRQRESNYIFFFGFQLLVLIFDFDFQWWGSVYYSSEFIECNSARIQLICTVIIIKKEKQNLVKL